MIYKDFKIEELFIKKTMKGYPKSKENLTPKENGFYVYGQNIKHQYEFKILMDDIYLHKVNPDHPILAYTSSVGEIGLIEESFYRSGDNGAFQALIPKNNSISRYELQYILSVLKKHFDAYGYATSMAHIIDLTFTLPATDKGEPDYEYMKHFMMDLENEAISHLRTYLKDMNLGNCDLTGEEKLLLEDATKMRKHHKTFPVTELFELKKGKRLTKANMISGNTNFIGSSSLNNGVTAKIGNTEHLHPAGTITVSYNGSVGEVFFQDEPFWASDDVNVWYPKFGYDQQVIEYIMATIKKLSVKYSYNQKWTLEKMMAETLTLPVKDDGNIDFEYMKKYITAIEKSVMAGALKEIDRISSAP